LPPLRTPRATACSSSNHQRNSSESRAGVSPAMSCGYTDWIRDRARLGTP
jgi:hypothetical protein